MKMLPFVIRFRFPLKPQFGQMSSLAILSPDTSHSDNTSYIRPSKRYYLKWPKPLQNILIVTT